MKFVILALLSLAILVQGQGDIWNDLGTASDAAKVTAIYDGLTIFKNTVVSDPCLTEAFSGFEDVTSAVSIQNWGSWLCTYWNRALVNTQVTTGITNDCIYKNGFINTTIELVAQMSNFHLARGYSVAQYNLTRDLLLNAIDLALGSPPNFITAATADFETNRLMFTNGANTAACATPTQTISWNVMTTSGSASTPVGGVVEFEWTDSFPHSVSYVGCQMCGSPPTNLIFVGFGAEASTFASPLRACDTSNIAGAFAAVPSPPACSLRAAGNFKYAAFMKSEGLYDVTCAIHSSMSANLIIGDVLPSKTPSNSVVVGGSVASDSGAAPLSSWMW